MCECEKLWLRVEALEATAKQALRATAHNTTSIIKIGLGDMIYPEDMARARELLAINERWLADNE